MSMVDTVCLHYQFIYLWGYFVHTVQCAWTVFCFIFSTVSNWPFAQKISREIVNSAQFGDNKRFGKIVASLHLVVRLSSLCGTNIPQDQAKRYEKELKETVCHVANQFFHWWRCQQMLSMEESFKVL